MCFGAVAVFGRGCVMTCPGARLNRYDPNKSLAPVIFSRRMSYVLAEERRAIKWPRVGSSPSGPVHQARKTPMRFYYKARWVLTPLRVLFKRRWGVI